MNPEAIDWLEGLDENERVRFFAPAYPFDGKLFSLKEDHERSVWCRGETG